MEAFQGVLRAFPLLVLLKLRVFKDKQVLRLNHGTFLTVSGPVASDSWYIFGDKMSPLLLESESPSLTDSILYFGTG